MQRSKKLTRNKKLASDILKEVIHSNNTNSNEIMLSDIKTALHECGFGILMIIFLLPLSLLILISPGYTTIFSIPPILLSLQFLFGLYFPSLPYWLERKILKRSMVIPVVEKIFPILKKIEKFIKPRTPFIFHRSEEKILAFITLFCTVIMALSFTFTHFFPAIGTIFTLLGLMGKNGFLSILIRSFNIIVRTAVTCPHCHN